MKRIYLLIVSLVVMLSMLTVAWTGFIGAQPASSGLSLIIYSDLALIEELRALSISVGESVRTIEDLPVTIVPSSVLFRPLQAGMRILEQELLLIQRQQYRQEPVLSWRIQSEQEGEVQGLLSYLAGGLGWSAYYTTVLNESEDQMALSSWVKLANQSGREYKNAKLTLVAGELRRVTQPVMTLAERSADIGVFKGERFEPTFETQPTFEYHEYKLTRPVTLKDEQTLQLSFFEAGAVKVSKHYVYEAAVDADRVRVEIRFTNDEANGLGVALPAGVVRLYKEANGALQLIGEDTLSHIPKNESVTLVAGIAFDLKVERVLKDHQVVRRDDDGYDIYRDVYEITLRNQKDTDVVIEVKEKLSGTWKIISAKPSYEKLDANAILFEVSVPANGTATVKYTVEWKNL
jgi:hypothetical protein